MTTTFVSHLECSVCKKRHSVQEIHTVCASCGKSLLARYDLARARRELRKQDLRSQGEGFWKYRPLLPVASDQALTTLGECSTPLVAVPQTGQKLGLANLWIKDEGLLPTGSFKTRGLALAVSRAKELGLKELCIPSAGNAGGALAAYAARAGMKSHIFMPEDTPAANVVESRAYGADVVLVSGTISDAAKAMNERRKVHADWFDVSTLKEPYRLEGKKTMGYELAEQFNDDLPDVILYPTGGGTGLIGMWKAFDEMEQLGWIGSKRPRMISVQSSGCAPIVRAYEEGKEHSEFWEGAATVASGLRVPKAFADYLILEAVRHSGGTAMSVSDADLIRAALEVSSDDGLFLCPEGGAAVAALKTLVHRREVGASERVVVFNTASGLKYLEAFDHPTGHRGSSR